MGDNSELLTLDENSDFETLSLAIAGQGVPISQRMRALFLARHKGGDEAVRVLTGGLGNSSVLFRHEVAYVLGQLRNPLAVRTLTDLLNDLNEDEMVRHEAAEALAAIGSIESKQLLVKHSSDPSAPVRETCYLALCSLEGESAPVLGSTAPPEAAQGECQSQFNTVDPIRPVRVCTNVNILTLRNVLRDSPSICKRYEAMFTLRNIATQEACEAINETLVTDQQSALLRHEVAFILGQLQEINSIDSLVQCLLNANEHRMARHEAALALGSIVCGDQQNRRHSADEIKAANAKAIKALQQSLHDPDQVVSESCDVALDNIKVDSAVLVP